MSALKYELCTCDKGGPHRFEGVKDSDKCTKCGCSVRSYNKDLKDAEDIIESVEKITDVLNHSNPEYVAKIMFTKIERTHRTLFQKFTGCLSSLIAKMGESQFVDGRNTLAVEWCKKVSKLEASFPYI